MAPAGAPFELGLLPRRARVDSRGRCSVAGVDLVELAEAHGTPLYVYDEDELRDRCREYLAAFGAHEVKGGEAGAGEAGTGARRAGVSYAAKAFLCLAMARLVDDEGLDLDVATGGEAHLAHRAGFPAERMVFHGNNKSELELRFALTLPVGRLVVDGFDELDRIESLVAAGLPRPSVLLRIAPGIDAQTHAHIATGAEDSKFGFTVSTGAARDAAMRAAKSDAMDLVGFHCHIGSQLFDLEPYALAAEVLASLAAEVRSAGGPAVAELNLGGGLGVPYTAEDLEVAPSIADFGAFVRRAFDGACRAAGLDSLPRLTVEAGRSIVAPAGLTLYRVGSVKQIPGGRTYVAVDGGMSDNPRPSMYGARYEAFLPGRATNDRSLTATVAGKHCEQGDLLVRDAQLPDDVSVGDVLATPVTGAYAHAMASNYNLVPRPAVVFVRDGASRVVVRRETLDDLVSRDVPDRGKTDA